jgi:hypothetical protein
MVQGNGLQFAQFACDRQADERHVNHDVIPALAGIQLVTRPEGPDMMLPIASMGELGSSLRWNDG